MQKKAIVFDVDGVITYSGNQKDTIIEQVLDTHGLLRLPWVSDILQAGLNRIIILQEIQKIKDFDFDQVLSDINSTLLQLENSTMLIQKTYDFLLKNKGKYELFTNTSMPKRKLEDIFERLELTQYFTQFFAYEDGTKKENIEHIIQVYGYNPKDILFIDDKQVHIDAVKPTWVHTLLFDANSVNLEKYVKDIFWK